MSLPDGFSEWEHLQSTIRSIFNRMVRDEFRDVGGDDWDANINTPRASLRHACTIKDNDTTPMVNSRMMLYYWIIGVANKGLHPVLGFPLEDIESRRKYKPQITLYFEEDSGDIEEDYPPVTGQISYRLMNEQNTTVTRQELISLGNRIKAEFGVGQGFVWRKGKDLASYLDKANGYDFRVLCRSKADAKELISKVLSTNNDTPDWEYLQYKENDQPATAYPTLPGTQIILGETRKKPRKRPIASVRFQYSYCQIWGIGKPIYLYDKSFRYFDTLVD